MIQIHISFNLFKWIYLKFKFKSIFLYFKSNPFKWIWIRYGLNIFLDYPNCILGWILTWPDLGRAKTVWVQIEQSRPKSTSSWVVRVQVESSRYGSKSTKSFRTKVKLSQPWVKSSWVADIESIRVVRSRYRAKLAQANVYSSRFMPMSSWVFRVPYGVERARVDIQTTKPRLMSNQADPSRCQDRQSPGQCRAEQAKADIESSGPGKMSSRAGSNRCCAEQAWIDVESFGSGLLSSVRAWADVESSGPLAISS